jgi:hypothetical protein
MDVRVRAGGLVFLLAGCGKPETAITEVVRVSDRAVLVTMSTERGSVLLGCSTVISWPNYVDPGQAEHLSDIACRRLATGDQLLEAARRTTALDCVSATISAGGVECTPAEKRQ